MKPEVTLYTSSFGTKMYFGSPAPGWVAVGRRLDNYTPKDIHEWTYLRVPDLLELASAARDSTGGVAQELRVKDASTEPAVVRQRQAREGLWRARIAARRFALRLIGYDLLAYSGPDVRWTLAFPKDDEATRDIGRQILEDSMGRDAFWKGERG